MAAATDPLFLIVDPDRKLEADVCSGPNADGRCPRVVEGGHVPCAGRELYLLNGDLGSQSARCVSSMEDECPVPIMCAGGG